MRKIVAVCAVGLTLGGAVLMAEEKATTATTSAPAVSAEQQKAIEAIEKMGGRADREGDDKPITIINLRDAQEATDDTLKLLKAFPEMTNLDLANSKVTDAGIDTIVEFKGLTHLLISDRPITDAGLAKLKVLTKLTLLDISRTNVTDKAVKELQAALPKCQIDWIFDHPEEPAEKKDMK